MTETTDLAVGMDFGQCGIVPSALPASVLSLDRSHPRSALEAAFLMPFLDGSQPYSERIKSKRGRDEGFIPPGGVLQRTYADESEATYLVSGPGWTMKLVFTKSAIFTSACEVMVIAVDQACARRALTDAGLLAGGPDRAESDVSMGFWHLSSHGSARVAYRDIHAPSWEEIHTNYSRTVDRAFSDLTRLNPDRMAGKGRLVLMYGPPGTGKTTAMRSLARAWRDWCHVDCVLDPDALFHNTGYLMDLTLYNHGAAKDTSSDKWRLLLIEDCDSLVRDDSRRAAGQSLARLLSLTDGLIGQGRNIIVSITTNEELSRLHPAVTRPGRCLARMEVDKLSPAEASDWLAGAGISAETPQGASLAELFALRDGHLPALEPQPSFGLYM